MGKTKTGFLQQFNTQFRFRHLGLGFLWAWIYCSWFSPTVFREAEGFTTNNDISWLISVAFVAVSLFIFPFVFKRDLISVRWVKICAPIGMTLGAIAMAQYPLFGGELVQLSYIGAAVTGITSSWLWIMWGEFFGSVDLEVTEYALPLTVALPTILMFSTLLVHGTLAGIAICCLPLLSGICLALSLSEKEIIKPVEIRKDAIGNKKYFIDFVKIGLGSVAIYTAISFCWSQISYNSTEHWSGIYIIFYCFAGIIAIIIAFLSFFYSSRKNIFSLYKWLIPVILFAFVALSFQTYPGQMGAVLFIIVAQYGFDIIVWVYFSSMIRKGICTGRVAAGINRGFVQLAVLIGSLLGIFAPNWVASGFLSYSTILLIIVAAMVTVTLFVLVNRNEENSPAHDTTSAGDTDDIEALCTSLANEYSLTKRETEIFRYLAKGRSIPYISDALYISKNTVESHVKSVYRKFNIHSRQELLDFIDQTNDAPG